MINNSELKFVFKNIREEVEKKFPHDEEVKYTAVVLVLFLIFFFFFFFFFSINFEYWIIEVLHF